MDAESIARINALAKKKHEEGLTPEETAEQAIEQDEENPDA